MNFSLRLPPELHAYLTEISKSEKISMNQYILELIQKDFVEKYTYSEHLKQKRLITDVSEILNKQNHAINELNKWHEIHTNILYELIGIGENDNGKTNKTTEF